MEQTHSFWFQQVMNISKKQPLNIPAEGKTASNKDAWFLNNTYSILAIPKALLLCHVLEVPSQYLLTLLPTSSSPAAWLVKREDLLICSSLHCCWLGRAHRLFQSIRQDSAVRKKSLCSTLLSLHATLFFIKPLTCLRPSVTPYQTFSLPCQTRFWYCPLSLRVIRDRHRIAQLVKETGYKYTRCLDKSHNFFWSQDWQQQ